MMERWQNIGKSEGLSSNAAIIGFLVSLYYSSGKQEEHKTDIRCQECQNPLTLFCVNCQLVSPTFPSHQTSPSEPAVHNTAVLSAPSSETEERPSHSYPLICTDSHIKTEGNSVTASSQRTRRKRRTRSCEKNKALKTVELEVSSDGNYSGLDEDVVVNVLPEVQEHSENKDLSDNRNDQAYSLNDFLVDLQEQTNRKARKRTHECPQCGETFEEPVDLQHHLEETRHSSDYVCKLCNKSFKNKSAVQQHKRVHSRQDQQCPICGLSFKFPSRLSKHLKTHGTDRPHVCDKCGKSFVSVYYLRDHIKIHSEERRYKCELCGAAFKQKPALYAHGKKHSNEKPFQCQYCGLKFRDSQKVKIHVRTHTGEKPYQCPMCDARFVSNSNMWQHCAYVHGKSTKSHQCPHCSLTFAAKGKLKIHIKNAHSGAEECEAEPCQYEVMRQPFYIELPGANQSDTSLTSMGTLCHVSMSL
ncbi:uncharacterized protein LOC143300765 [Babylonia areolata]|uniref:uncharacterized protein LOC143300765 n=1 Tax=Babylonia areolata TaxID=304850 RepID=UPI003FD403CE